MKFRPSQRFRENDPIRVKFLGWKQLFQGESVTALCPRTIEKNDPTGFSNERIVLFASSKMSLSYRRLLVIIRFYSRGCVKKKKFSHLLFRE